MNASVKYDGFTFGEAAAGFLATRGIACGRAESGIWADLAGNTLRHPKLTVVALVAAVLAGVGAGLADPIVTGLALNDMSLVLQGAIPAAILALVTELVFEGVERMTVPGHLRLSSSIPE